MKDELERIRYNLVCTNDLWCTDRPDLINEDNKEDLLFKTDLNTAIHLVDRLIEEVENNSIENEEVKKIRNIYYKIGDDHETLPFNHNNLLKTLNKFSTKLNEFQKDNKELCNEITEKNKTIDNLTKEIRESNQSNNELVDELQDKLSELSVVPKKLFYTINGKHNIIYCEPDTLSLNIDNMINKFEEEIEELNKELSNCSDETQYNLEKANQKLHNSFKREQKKYYDRTNEYNDMVCKYDNLEEEVKKLREKNMKLAEENLLHELNEKSNIEEFTPYKNNDEWKTVSCNCYDESQVKTKIYAFGKVWIV